MRTLFKALLGIFFLTFVGVSWAACPEGQKQTYKGCEVVEEKATKGQPAVQQEAKEVNSEILELGGFLAEEIQIKGQPARIVTAGAFSHFLKQGIGIALMDEGGFDRSALASISCIDGEWHDGVLAELPFYDRQAEIPRGKRVDIPQRN